MTAAASSVRTVEITRATRSVTLDEVAVREGDLLALVDDRVVAAGKTLPEVLGKSMDCARAASAEVITIYHGNSVADDEAAAVAGQLGTQFPRAELQVLHGGQPHYDYIISVE
jgi:dihydroxyacetone kinase-like predicted kinase